MRMRLIRACAVLLLLAAALSIAPAALAQGTQADRIQETVATAKFKKAPPYRIGVAAGYLSNSWVVFCLQHVRYEASRHPEIAEVLVTDAGFNPGKQVADIEKAEGKLGGYTIKALDIVLLRTDAAKKRLEKAYLTDHPGMTKESVHFILDRGVKVMGIDAIGFDPPVAKMFERKKFWEAHRVMREREYYHLENLCNLHEIPAPYHSFLVSVLPVKWRGASAAPVRAVAIID